MKFETIGVTIISKIESLMWKTKLGKNFWNWLTHIGRKKLMMLKIGVVGDLSGSDPYRLGKVLHAAMEAADVVIQVGDLMPGYDVVKEAFASGKVFPIPGNHDVEWNTRLPMCPRQWIKQYPECILVGLDNSTDTINQEGWDLLSQVDKIQNPPPIFVSAHKSPIPLILQDGSISLHIQGEGQPCPDAEKLIKWLNSKNGNATMLAGHLHSFSWQKSQDFDLILEGRGGASSELAYTLILVSKDGWVSHSVPII